MERLPAVQTSAAGSGDRRKPEGGGKDGSDAKRRKALGEAKAIGDILKEGAMDEDDDDLDFARGAGGAPGGPPRISNALLSLVLKQLLRNTQELRDLSAVVYYTLLVPINHPFYLAGRAAAQKYDQACKSAGKGHKFGGPIPHIFLAAIESVQTAAEAVRTAGGEATAKMIEKAVEYGKFKHEEIEEKVPHFRFRKTFKKEEHSRLTVSLRDVDMLRPLLAFLGRTECVLKQGRAPAGVMERKLSEALTRMEGRR